MNRRSEWSAKATAAALDKARERARAEGRKPTAEEFAAAINDVGEPPERKKRGKREPVDRRWGDFKMWIWTLSYSCWLKSVKQAPGGFDPILFAGELSKDAYHRKMCVKALEALREAIPLLESVLADTVDHAVDRLIASKGGERHDERQD